ncbi:MAG: TolC family protein [Firmicutes bacterium]|nr:TolC family protein [Bacillota bacterium]
MKKAISILLACALILGSGAAAFADPATTDIKFEGEEIRLSVADVVAKMTTEGTAAETVRLNRLSDEAIANGYKENYDTLKSMRDYVNALPFNMVIAAGMQNVGTGVDQRVIGMTRDFAKANLEKNSKADLNKLEMSIYQLYYQTLLAQESLKVTWDNYVNKKNTLELVRKKYSLGAASRLEVTTAENMLVSADKDLHDARGTWYAARMNFNMQAGYPLMANTVLTQEIEPAAMPAVTLEEAIASALAKRNEIGSVKFGMQVQDVLWAHAQLTASPVSSEYQKQKVSFLQMQQAADNIENQIELGVRADYLTLAKKKQAIDAADSTIALAAEAYRIQKVSYELGASTLQDLNDTLANLNAAKLGKVSAVCDYNLALQQYIFDMGVGTSRVDL